jgi:superfamily II helicase
LWSLFAGVLIAIGFIWRSPTLRWMAIILFATTLLKILIVDMAGVNELYRFGAVFALATLLALATWAYQRFRIEGQELQS